MKNINKTFLEKKHFSYNMGWGSGVINVKSSSGNIDRLSENVFKFIQHNFLPCDGSSLNGHYLFYVNYKTFGYVVIKHSEYGSLTYTRPTKEKGVVKLNKIDKKIVEAIIADKLLKAYFYDFDSVNQQGNFLIESNIDDDVFLERYRKQCLISDYRNYLWSGFKPNLKTENDYLALSLIDNDFIKCNVDNITFCNFIKNDGIYKFTIEFLCNGVQKKIDIIRNKSYCGIHLNFIIENQIILRNNVSIKNLKPFKDNLKDCLTMICENKLI